MSESLQVSVMNTYISSFDIFPHTSCKTWSPTGQNNLVGNLPSEIGRLTNLQVAFLGTLWCCIAGVCWLVDYIGRGTHNILPLNSDTNLISGSIPIEVEGLKALRTITACKLLLADNHCHRCATSNFRSPSSTNADNNRFNGPLPTQLGLLTNLESLLLCKSAP